MFADGAERPCGGLLVPVTLHQRSRSRSSSAPAPPSRSRRRRRRRVDARYSTSVPGLFAAGDVSAQMPSVANAVAAGAGAAAMVVHDVALGAPAGVTA